MKKLDFKIFRNNLRILRVSKGMTSKELSALAELHAQKRVADFEDDRGVPTLQEVYQLSIALECTMDDLLTKQVEVTLVFKTISEP